MEAVEKGADQSDLFDLVVIGGGPAGTSAAITAARGGARVLLLERGSLPRQRVCGEFVSAESLAILSCLLAPNASALLSEALRISQARLFFDGHVVPAEIAPAAASIGRFNLDFALWRAAQRARVDPRVETTVESVTGNGPFLLRTRDHEFRSRAVINATGRWSNLRVQSRRSEPDSQEKWVGLKGHFSDPLPHSSVDLYFFEGGYCGVQSVKLVGGGEGRVNACAMVRSDVARCLPDVFAQHADLRMRATHWKPLMDPVSTSPLFFGMPEPVDKDILMVGDAAGFVDPFIGDGISLALRSGRLAADCLAPFLNHETSLHEATMRYRLSYRNRLLPVFKNSSRLRRLLRLPRPMRRSFGHLLEATPALSRLLVRITR